MVVTNHTPQFAAKSVGFMGGYDDYIVSGSDCGNIYIWDKKSRNIVQFMRGDEDVVCFLFPIFLLFFISYLFIAFYCSLLLFISYLYIALYYSLFLISLLFFIAFYYSLFPISIVFYFIYLTFYYSLFPITLLFFLFL